jgi:D-sedoheptulose 7-phosphate isomerase
MDQICFFNDFFRTIDEKIKSVDVSLLHALAKRVNSCKESGRKIIIVGNGGSAAIASHVAVDLTKAAKVRAINFNEADLITCFANDYGYENWVSEALKAYADDGDLVILISSSGKSLNLINAAITARQNGVVVVTLTGFDSANRLRQLGDLNFWVDSQQYNVVESVHQTWILAVVDRLICYDK